MNKNDKETRDIFIKCSSLNDFIDLGENKKSIIDKNNKNEKLLRDGNSFLIKRGSNANVKFFVFDLPQLITCPGATEECRKNCYQKSVEKMHRGKDEAGNQLDSTIILHRKYNLYYSLRDDFVDKLYHEIIHKRLTKDTVIIRIHASGDFYSKEYFLKWLTISLAVFLAGKNYLFAAYTKSFEELNEALSDQELLKRAWDHAHQLAFKTSESTPSELALHDFGNIKIIGSIMDDTSEDKIGIIEKYGLSKYTVTETECKKTDCKSKDCASCMICYKKHKTDVVTFLRK